MIIAIEGIDSAGKHTQAVKLAERIGAKVFSFPNYETDSGQVILANLQSRWAAKSSEAILPDRLGFDRVNALALQSIFAVNRYESAQEIHEACVRGHVVLDRYWLSGVVYGSCDGLDEEWLERIHMNLPQPDVWILLDVPPAASIERRPERRDRYESDGNMDKRRDIYRRLFEARQKCTLAGEWCVIDGLGSVDEVHTRIYESLRLCGMLSCERVGE